MRIELRFKTPDVVDNAMEELVYNQLIPWPTGSEDMSDEEIEAWQDTYKTELAEKIKKHVQWGEYLTVYYNTETDKLELK